MKGSFILLLVVLVGSVMWRHAATPCGASDEALTVAVAEGDVEAVRRCLRRNGSATANEMGMPLLGMAAWHGQRHVMRALLDEFGFDVNAKSPTGWSPLMMAVLSRDAEAVEMLLCAGADVSAATDTGATAISVAIDREYEDIVERILNVHARCTDRVGESVVTCGP